MPWTDESTWWVVLSRVADLFAASMVGLMNPASDDLFEFPAVMRQAFTEPIAKDSEFAPIFAWRDEVYRKHRGEAVKP